MSRVAVLEVLGNSAGGIATHVAQLARSLGELEDIRIGVAAPPGLPVAMTEERMDLEIPDGVWGHRKAAGKLAELASGWGADLIHAHGLRAGLDAGRAGRRIGIPVVTTVHNLVRPEIAGRLRYLLYRLVEPAVTRTSARTLAVSEDIAARLRSAAPGRADTVEVTYLGVGGTPETGAGKREVRRGLSMGDDQALAVCAARLSPQKDLPVLFEAVARTPGLVLALFGEGPLEGELRKTAASLSVGDRVRFMGFRDDVHDHIAAADVFVLSSIWEGVPLAAQEAILLGTPVVATAVGGLPELIEDGRTGRLVAPSDPGALADALADVIGDPAGAALMAAAARSHLEERFSTERMLERLAAIYHEVADVS